MNPAERCKAMEMSESADHLLTTLSANGPRLDCRECAAESAGGIDGTPPYTPGRQGRFVAPIGELMTLNVGGARFVTTRNTLERVSGTRLSNLHRTDPNYNPTTGEWFFDRNPALFNYILDFYRTDELHFPHNYCGPSIKKELIYWTIDETDISSCCWNRYREFEEENRIFDQIEQAFESRNINLARANTGEMVNPSNWQIWRQRLYLFLEEPMSSRPAQVWTVMFLAMVLSSIGILCIETVPGLRIWVDEDDPIDTHPVMSNMSMLEEGAYKISNNLTTTALPTTENPHKEVLEKNMKIRLLMLSQPHPALEHIDSFCTCFFTIEFLCRLLVAPNRIKFWKSVMNIIDVLCVLPMWIKYVMIMYEIRMNMQLLPLFFIIMMLRVLRICRVLRLARHYTGVKILVLALKASFQELFMLMIFVFIVVLIFAVVIYYAEFFVFDTFPTIPDGYWWAIVTLTTVGYGDMYPKSPLGYVVGSLCALTGILATGLPVPIIANNFNLYYTHAKLKEQVRLRKSSRRASVGSDKDIVSEDRKQEPLIVKEASV